MMYETNVFLSLPVLLDILVRTSQKPSSSWSKSFKMKLKQLVEKFLQNNLVLNFIVTIILAVTEEIMELEFTCAPQPYNLVFFVIFIIAPSGIFFFLNFIIQGFVLNLFDVKKDKWYYMVWQSSFPPWMWFVIVLLDGRYLQCAMSRDHDASKKPTNDEMSTISKIAGLVLFLFLTFLMLISYWIKNCWKSNQEPNQNPGGGNAGGGGGEGGMAQEGGETREEEKNGEESRGEPSLPGRAERRAEPAWKSEEAAAAPPSSGHQLSSPSNQSVTLLLRALEEEDLELQMTEGVGAASTAPEERLGDEGEPFPGPLGLGTVSRKEEKVQADRGRGEEMKRAGSGAKEQRSSGDKEMLPLTNLQVQ